MTEDNDSLSFHPREYTYVWEYEVRADCLTEFEAYYGSEGIWVRLFRRAEGYGRTELHRDRCNPLRYITIDYWESLEHFQAFRSKFANEFEYIDATCEAFTTSEHEIGQFEEVTTKTQRH